MFKRKFLILTGVLLLLAAVPWSVETARATQARDGKDTVEKSRPRLRGTTAAQRKAAAERLAAAKLAAGSKAVAKVAAMNPGGTPDYFGSVPNFANSPLPLNNPAAVPLVLLISGGGGAGAAATATVTNGVVSGVTLSAGGTGYVATPTVSISAPTAGVTATAIATVDPTWGVITAVTVTNGGSGYTAAPTVNIVGPGGAGAGATAIATIDAISGAVTAIQVTNGGAGYNGPVVTIDPTVATNITAGGSGATFAPTVDPVTTAITAITITNPGSGYWLMRNANGTLTNAIRKFVDGLPGLGSANANNLGNFIPVAVPNTTAYPGSDYYQINLVQYTQKLHSDLPATLLRGYADVQGDGLPHYMGPVIMAQSGRASRILFTNNLTANSSFFLPIDTTIMGAGMGPDGTPYSPNRATLHLHGGDTPWISDGTPHQWTCPAGETTNFAKGVSARDVPDMPATGAGQLTFYYPNGISNRLMFYHDHAYGITRLNVYAGEASGYIITDAVENGLITSGVLPNNGGGVYNNGIPLIIQDKTFVDALNIANQDPTWNWGTTPGTPTTGDLWFPHVYMTNQNPWDPMGVNNMGRWDYGPWFWPPFTGMIHGAVPNPLAGQPGEPPMNPGTPNPSLVPEGFMDTPIVNGEPYPYLKVGQMAYRFRILNVCNDRTLNLQLYYAKAKGPMWDAVTGALINADAGEVPMVPAVPGAGLPATWPTDGRAGGAPDPKAVGPSFIQIGTEGGFLPAPVVLPNTPVGYEYNRRNIVVLNVSNHTLLLGPAERADVIVDFSGCPDGSNIIMYNDAPAPDPGFDPRFDYYTGDPDQTSTGGAPSTQPGYGPNTRTIMQFQVSVAAGTAATYNLANLQAAFTGLAGAYASTQSVPIVPQAEYNANFAASFPANNHAAIQDTQLTFTPAGQTAPVTLQFQPKAIQELFEVNYGRMNATLGVELPFTNMTTQTTIPYGYVDPSTELVQISDPALPIGALGDGTQIWKITHNGVDTHTVHVHLFNAQIINRVGWDGMIKPPDPNELGWKESMRMNPLEDVIIALRPVKPSLPFKLANSIRPMDPTMPIGSTGQFTNIDPKNNPVTVTNQLVNYGWEYVWHCHLLGHEENDFMRAVMIGSPPETPTNLASSFQGNKITLTWNDNSITATNFTVQRANDALFTTGLTSFDVLKVPGTLQTFVDTTYNQKSVPYYYRVAGYFVMGGVAPGYDSMQVYSLYSNVVGPPAGVTTLTSVTQTTVKNSPVVLTWTYVPSGDQTGFTIQRSENAGFTLNVTNYTAPATTTSYSDSKHKTGVTYWYRVQAFNNLGVGTWSNVMTILAH